MLTVANDVEVSSDAKKKKKKIGGRAANFSGPGVRGRISGRMSGSVTESMVSLKNPVGYSPTGSDIQIYPPVRSAKQPQPSG
jgi:hypothetical protein